LRNSPEGTLELNASSFIRRFRVLTNSFNDGPITVSSAVGLPRAFQLYSTPNEHHNYARCRSVECDRLEPKSLYWIVTCHYSTPEVQNGKDGANTHENAGENDNPLLIIPEIETHTERYEQPIYWVYNPTVSATTIESGNTQNGNEVVFAIADVSQIQVGMTVTGAGIPAGTTVSEVLDANEILLSAAATQTLGGNALTFTAVQLISPVRASNGEIFDPPPMKDASRLILTITRNEDITAPHPLTSVLFTDTVNSDIFFACLPGQVKCMGVTAAKQTKQLSNGAVFSYLKCVYQFQMRPTWDLYILNAGNWYWTDIKKLTKQKFLTEDQHPRQGLLDINGLKLADGLNPLFVGVRPYQRQKFSPLNLPQSFLQAS
jgi:hypothetical protein